MAHKLEKMSRFLPGLYKPEENPYVRGTLYAWATEDDLIVQAVQDAKEQLFVKFAQFQFLDALGSNVGVFRPSAINLADAQYRELIPALSFRPKQILPTIKRVLDVFFGVGNPRVFVKQVKPNEIVIQIPSSVPALRRTLKGANHLKAYSGEITNIDNVGKTLTIDIEDSSKSLLEDEWAGGLLGQDITALPILSNTPGTTGVTVQFSASTDLSDYVLGRYIVAAVPNYPGAFMPDTTRPYSVTRARGILGQSITAGNIYPVLNMTDSSGIPDAPGHLVFSFGRENEEGGLAYFGRPNNSTLLLDPSYNFLKDHSIGEVVNMIVKPYQQPAINGSDYSVYYVEVEAARILAQQIVQSIVAAGVVIRWIVNEPVC